MQTILINASITWFCCLLVYELLLKKETFHRLNRFYLLFTFMAGILLPLLPWGQSVHTTVFKSTAGIIPGATVPGVPVPEAHTMSNAALSQAVNWGSIFYIAGVAATLLHLLRDLFRLRRIYTGAAIQKDGTWIIAITGKAHSPFSLLNVIFVSDKEQYTAHQWQMILQHEQQHHRSRHILDVILMQIAVTLFWFHPLVYIYRYKLRLLHEYEVDSMQQEDIQTYGRFLLEQAALKQSPAMTHSFSFSPLKDRIHMMTRNASKYSARYRLLLLLPMMSLFIWCCTRSRPEVAVDIKDRYAVRHDAQLGYSPATAQDTLMIQTGNGQQNMVVMVRDPVPEKLNGRDILQTGTLKQPVRCTHPGTDFSIRYLIEHAGIEATLKKMNDGDYFMAISDVIIDSAGYPVYYMMTFPENNSGMVSDEHGFQHAKPSGLTDADKELIQKKISAILIGGDIAFTAGKTGQGTEVPYFLGDVDNADIGFKLRTRFTVKNHVLTYAL